MSLFKGYLSPAARAALEAVLAKLAAPGMANPDDPWWTAQPAKRPSTATPAPRPNATTTGCTLQC